MGFFGLWRRAEPADGASTALEVPATGITPAMLSAAEVAPPSSTSRRERSSDPGTDVIADSLSAKVLNGWLQNRHQTLVPLTLNLTVMSAPQREAVATSLAAILLAGRGPEEALDVVPMLRNWLSGLGADPATLAAFDAALETPPPINAVFDQAQSLDLTIYAYVAALMASDARYPASLILCDLVQARFELPTPVVRSATRRFRR